MNSFGFTVVRRIKQPILTNFLGILSLIPSRPFQSHAGSLRLVPVLSASRLHRKRNGLFDASSLGFESLWALGDLGAVVTAGSARMVRH